MMVVVVTIVFAAAEAARSATTRTALIRPAWAVTVSSVRARRRVIWSEMQRTRAVHVCVAVHRLSCVALSSCGTPHRERLSVSVDNAENQ